MVNPILRGWGGIRLIETTRHTKIENDSPRSTPASIVFSGEVASNAEMTCLEMKKRGYNTVRAYWEFPLTQQSPEWGYDDDWMGRFIDIAKKLGFYIVVDCHGYREHYQYEDEWISHWNHIVSTFKDRYDKIVWQPQNEPLMPESGAPYADVAELARIYQRWINMCRGLGDTHWIIVSGICWWSPLPFSDWFPVVNDILNKVFLDYHKYYFYEYNRDAWTIEGAEASADLLFDQFKNASAKHHRPFLSCELGAAPYSTGYEYDAVPNAQYGGAAGYSTVSLAHVNRMIENFHNAGWGYILWTAGDWGKDWTPGWHHTGLYGGMDTWGDKIPLPTPTPIPPIDLPTIGGIALAIADAALVGYYIYTKVKGK